MILDFCTDFSSEKSQNMSQTLMQESLYLILKFDHCLAASAVHRDLKGKFSQLS